MRILPYDRYAAVQYAHRWAFTRNPEYYDFSYIGGDCTNFASQCLYSGTGIMNYTPDFGWYYIDPDNRAAAWTGVSYFWNFMTRSKLSVGPIGVEIPINLVLPGDYLQFSFRNSAFEYTHTAVIVAAGAIPTPENILVAAHSDDADYRPLNSYRNVKEIRYLHILGALDS